jgi:hypothetical protein
LKPEIRKGFTRSEAGREFLESEIGLRVNWHVRPEKETHMGFSQLMHNLVLTRVLVAAHRFAKHAPDFRLTEVRICYELSGSPPNVDVERQGKRRRFLLFRMGG